LIFGTVVSNVGAQWYVQRIGQTALSKIANNSDKNR